MPVRSREKAEAVAADIRGSTGNAKVEVAGYGPGRLRQQSAPSPTPSWRPARRSTS